MEWRRPTQNELSLFYEIHPEVLGRETLRSGRAAEIWNKIIKTPGFQGAVTLNQSDTDLKSPVGVGASVFVDDAFAERELADPRPGLNNRVATTLLSERGINFDRQKIAMANGGKGVNVVVLVGRWHPKLIDPQVIKDVRLTLAAAFAETHAGFRFQRVLIELIDQQDRNWASSVPFLKIHRDFDKSGRALVRIEKSDIADQDATLLTPHFFCPSPKLSLREADQELLMAALENPTDESLANRLDLTKEGIKRRWRTIFERVEREMPEIFETISRIEKSSRGPQKRHLVLGYVRRHPQELRPYAAALELRSFGGGAN